MVELMFAFGMMVLIILVMSVGVIFSSKPIKGTCGGMAALGIDTSCDICGGDTSKCEEENTSLPQAELQPELAYEVSSKG